jgi:glucokinase
MPVQTPTRKHAATDSGILMAEQDLFLGVDIGGTNTKFGFVDDSGNSFEIRSFATEADRSFVKFVEKLSRQAKASLQELPDRYVLRGIGIGAPNANYLSGCIEEASNLSWGTVDVVGEVSKHFSVPIVITNDANAAAMGEKKFGAARDLDNFIVITLGTGLGGGIFMNGQLVHGAGGHAGEIGHTIVRPEGRQCNCGRRGCLETYVSATGIRRTVFELLSDRPTPSLLRRYSFENLSAEDISNAAGEEDEIALLAFDRTAEILGMKLSDFIAYSNPQIIILTGGLTNAGDLLLKPVRKYMEKFLLKVYRGKTELVISNLREKNLAVLGASALVMEKVLTQEIR